MPKHKNQFEATAKQEGESKNLATESQSARTAALLSAAADLEQIASNFEEEAKRENDRFRRGVSPAKAEWWIENHLVGNHIAAIFDCPFPLHQSDGLPHNKKEFSLIIDTFSLYMPRMVTPLGEVYNNFLHSIKFHLEGAIRAEKEGETNLLFWCSNFAHTTIPATVRRLRHIAAMVKNELTPGESAKTGYSQQAQTPPEIELIEQIVARLKQWTQKHPHAKRIKPSDFHNVCYGLKVELESATDGLNDILFYLRENGQAGKAEAIEKLYGHLLHKVRAEYHSRSDGLAPMYLELDYAKKAASLLVKELQSIKPAGIGQDNKMVEEDEMITVTEAAKLLGVDKGMVSRWATDGVIKDNGETKRKRRVSKVSVLLLKNKREREDRLKDVADVLQDMERKIPYRH